MNTETKLSAETFENAVKQIERAPLKQETRYVLLSVGSEWRERETGLYHTVAAMVADILFLRQAGDLSTPHHLLRQVTGKELLALYDPM